jgi:serine phosphatase RsbU (regulator of sigma subunit)/HEAT repeat protein
MIVHNLADVEDGTCAVRYDRTLPKSLCFGEGIVIIGTMFCRRQTNLNAPTLAGLALGCFAAIAFSQGSPDQLNRNIEDLSRKEITTRVRAAQSIGNYGKDALPAMQILVKRLDADYEVWQVKEACAQSLGKIGPVAKEALPSLRAAMESRHSEVVVAAAWAVGEILRGSDTTKDLADNVAALLQKATSSEEVRKVAKASVAEMGPKCGPILLEFLTKNPDPTQARFAAQILADSIHLSLDDVVAYRRLLANPDAEVKTRFAAAVTKVAQECASAGATCLAQLPKIKQLELTEPIDPTLRQYEDGIKMCESYLNLIASRDGASVILRYGLRFAIPAELFLLAMIVGLVWLLFSGARKSGALRRTNKEAQEQIVSIQGEKRNLEERITDLNERIDEISDRKAAVEHNETARAVLQRFVPMPRFEDRSGFQIASSSKNSSDVSGDFHNWSTRTDGSLSVYLVDVEGSGIDAAIQATHAAKVLERILTRGDLKESPTQLLADADRAMQRELGPQNIAVTMNLLEIHPDQIRLASAGMPAPLLFRHLQAQPQQLLAAGVYVGAGYSRFRILPRSVDANVTEGDLLILFSDGVLEARNESGKIFGRNGIETAVARVRQADPKAIADAILLAAAEHAGTDLPADDQTVVVVRFGVQTPVGTGAETLVTMRLDKKEAEFTIINAANTAEVCYSELRPKITDWVPSDRLDQPNRIWCAVWDGLTDAVSHGSYRGDIIYLRLWKDSEGVVVELEQPMEWREWDRYLGIARKENLSVGYPKSSNDVGGTATLLRLSDSITGSMQGRLLSLSFRYRPTGAERDEKL